jgi:hypothetical protein
VQGVMTIGRATEADWTALAEAWLHFGATDAGPPPDETKVGSRSVLAPELKPQAEEVLAHHFDI